MMLKNQFSILLFSIALSVIGLLLVFELNFKLLPSTKSTKMVVSYYWSNVPARVIETEAGAKLEAALAAVPGLVEINSNTTIGAGKVELVFDKSAKIEHTGMLVSGIVRRIYKQLPQGVSYPEISIANFDSEKSLLLSFAFTGTANKRVLENQVRNIVIPRLSGIKNIERIDVSGEELEYVSIAFKNDRLKSLGLKRSELLQLLNEKFISESLGEVNIDNQNEVFTVNLRAKSIASLAALEQTEISVSKYKTFKISEIANVSIKTQLSEQVYKINGDNTLSVFIYPKANANLVNLSAEIKEVLNQIGAEFENNTKVKITYDASEYIKAELDSVSIRVISTFLILLVFTFIISFSFKYVFSVLISLLVNLFIGTILFYILKVEIHIYSMVAITVSLGVLINNAIVVIESLRTAGRENIKTALLAATLSTLMPLLFILFSKSSANANLKDFALVMIILVAVSVPVGLFFTPAIANYIQLRRKTSSYRKIRFLIIFNAWFVKRIIFLRKYKKTVAVVLILFFGLPVFLLPKELKSDHRLATVYNNTLGTQWYQSEIKPIADLWLGGTIRLFYERIFKYSVSAGVNEQILQVYAKNMVGGSTEQLAKGFSIIENELKKYPQIASFVTSIESNKSGNITIYFKKEHEFTNFPSKIKSIIINKIVNLKGFEWVVSGVGDPYSNSAQVEIKDLKFVVTGYDLDQVYFYANCLRTKLLENKRVSSAGLTDNLMWLSVLTPESRFFEINNVQLSKLSKLHPNLYLNKISNIQKNTYIGNLMVDNSLKMVLIEPEEQVFNKYTLLNDKNDLNLFAAKLNSVATISTQSSGFDIYRENRSYRIVVEFNYRGSDIMRNEFLKQTDIEFNETLPLGYKCRFHVYGWQAKEQLYGLTALIIFLALFFIAAILFESLADAIIIPLVAPLSVAGSILSFVYFRIPFDQGGFASLLFVAGISVSSAIYVLNKKRSLSYSGVKSIVRAINYKFVSIIITIASTIAGLLPIIFFAETEAFWTAFAYGTIGGLVFSVPVVILILIAFSKTER